MTTPKNNAIIVLRVMATALITGTHLNSILGALAVGGLLGDVLFFAISGYCYGKGIEKNFGEWYALRWRKLYPPVLVMTAVNFLSGVWSFPAADAHAFTLYRFFSVFVIPTNFAFFGAIIFLYVPLYFYVNSRTKYRIPLFAAAAVAFVLYYAFGVDHRHYSMNNTGNITVLFVYFLAAASGCESFCLNRRGFSLRKCAIGTKCILTGTCIVSGMIYAFFTLFFRHASESGRMVWQIAVPISLLITCALVMNCVLAFEDAINRMPEKIFRFFRFFADLTLEIYVVQFLVIKYLSGLVFPLNLILILVAIVLAAWGLKRLCLKMTAAWDFWIQKSNWKAAR